MKTYTYLAVAVVASITMACQSTGPNTTTINGLYSLVSRNGTAMPIVTAGPDSLLSETLQFTQSGVFDIAIFHTVPGPGLGRTEVRTHLTGTYTRDGSSVAMQYNDGLGLNQASFDGTTVKTTFNGDAKVYVAQ